jgi:hypothetical protein
VISSASKPTPCSVSMTRSQPIGGAGTTVIHSPRFSKTSLVSVESRCCRIEARCPFALPAGNLPVRRLWLTHPGKYSNTYDQLAFRRSHHQRHQSTRTSSGKDHPTFIPHLRRQDHQLAYHYTKSNQIIRALILLAAVTYLSAMASDRSSSAST